MTLDITTLETWLWEAACRISGPVDAPKYKDYILPLVFLKRLSDVFDDELARLGEEFGDMALARELVEDDHALVRFYVPPQSRWNTLAKLTTGLGEALTDAVRGISRENPRLAMVLDTGAVSRGSGNRGSNRARDARAQFVEDGLVEAVVLLPENLFYNTTAPGIIRVLNKAKPALSAAEGTHSGETLLINASLLFAKGRPKNELTDEHVAQIAALYHDWQEEGLSAIITHEEAARNDYNLSPSRYVVTDEGEGVLPLEEVLVLLREAEEEQAEADAALEEVLRALGF